MLGNGKDGAIPLDLLSKLFGVTPRNITQLTQKGILFSDGHNKYPAIRNIKAYINYLRDSKGYNSNSPLADQKLRLTQAQADKVEIQNQVASGNLIPIDLLTVILSEISGSVAGVLDTIPAKIKRKHPHMDNQIIESIKAQIIKAMNQISDIDEVVERVIDDYISEEIKFKED